MTAYKLVRKLKDGTLAPLFINKKHRFVIGKRYNAEAHRTKGFAYRPGWHCCLRPEAPHLSEKDRVWVKVSVTGLKYYDRPESQGGVWVLADTLKVLGEV